MGKPLRVLVIEDSDDDCEYLIRELRRGDYEPSYERVDTAKTLERALDHQIWDIIFGDYTMPTFSGIQALAMVRSRGIDAPFIFLSGTIGEDTAVSAMKAGAQDYLMKGHLKRLVPAVDRELHEAEMRRERERTEMERRTIQGRLRGILTMAADAIIAVDHDLRIVLFNQGAERLFGYRTDEVLNQFLDMLLPSRYVQAHRFHVAQFAQDPDEARPMNQGREVYGRRKDGSEFPAEASISKLVEGGHVTFTVIMRDITERKRAEEEVRLLREIGPVASDTADVQSALKVTLSRICDSMHWSMAQVWRPDDNAWVCAPVWHSRDGGFEPFRVASIEHRIKSGEDLPGRVGQSRAPIWLVDATTDDRFLRKDPARSAGLRTGVAVPVTIGDDIIAVLEFFARETRAYDARSMTLLSAAAGQVGSVIQRKLAEERLHHLAHHDALTDLPNRVLFNDRLRRAIWEANRHRCLVGIAFLDVDRFKTINDSLGHAIGDLFLKSVADRLSLCIREGDTVARLSGDEFALVLPDIGHTDGVVRVAQRICDQFTRPFSISGHELYSSASIGLTVYPLDDNGAEGLLSNADIAMYRAKESGGNTYHFYSAEMTGKAQERLQMENEMRRALQRNEFLVYYQPLLDLQSKTIVAAEALVRWNHPERGLISPGDFIGVAEETGMILKLGTWVLHTACAEIAGLGFPDLRISVNVSPRQFQQNDLCSLVAEALEQNGFGDGRLELEITESLLVQNSEIVLGTMQTLSQMGVQFSVDDFGVGYSCLSYLKRLPIRSIKIDHSFIQDVPDDPNDVAIVEAIISMAHTLGMQVVAEGVETKRQMDFLEDHGCDIAQGYYFYRPAPFAEFARIIQEARSRV